MKRIQQLPMSLIFQIWYYYTAVSNENFLPKDYGSYHNINEISWWKTQYHKVFDLRSVSRSSDKEWYGMWTWHIDYKGYQRCEFRYTFLKANMVFWIF